MNGLGRIQKIWAFLSVDPKTGDEGVMATTLSPEFGPIPLIAADQRRLESLRPIAEDLARQTGIDVVLVEFSSRRDLELILRGPKQ
jgi:hypothetical protein